MNGKKKGIVNDKQNNLRVLHTYLTNLNETFTINTFEVAKQHYLVVKRLFTLTKVL